MNNELLSLYKADRQERLNQPKANTPEYKAMRGRDLERRERVMEIAGAGELYTPEDFYHAAWIMNHGDTPNDAKNAHLFALHSREVGYCPARWLRLPITAGRCTRASRRSMEPIMFMMVIATDYRM